VGEFLQQQISAVRILDPEFVFPGSPDSYAGKSGNTDRLGP
jgi:hypothetical protein